MQFILNAILVFCMSYLSTYGYRIVYELISFAELFLRGFNGKQVQLEGNINFTKYCVTCQMSNEFKSILYKLHTSISTLPDIKYVESIDYVSSNTTESNRKMFNIPIQFNCIKCGKVRIHVAKSKFSENNDHFGRFDIVNVKITIAADTYDIINEFVSKCAQEYEVFVSDKKIPQSCFVFSGIDDNDSKPLYTMIPFESNKTVDNIFFQGKDDIVNRIRFFESNSGIEHYKKIGAPRTFGMLFSGASGTGKTSMIKAIANLTKRHLVIIRMDLILRKYRDKCVDILRTIMMSPEIGDCKVPQSQRLYVFEEADTWQHLLNRTTSSSDPIKSSVGSTKTDIVQSLLSLASPEKEDFSVLGGILELLDGVVEMPGRMCVMTSNHPDRLDPALVRRFNDVNKTFGPLDRDSIQSMYKQWFDKDSEFRIDTSSEWTQATLYQEFCSHISRS